MEENYKKYFEYFHNEKQIIKTGKKKYQKCTDCENLKDISEKDNILKFGCGVGKGCGDKFTIQLPQYVTVQDELLKNNNIINGIGHYDDISNLNLKKLNKYIDLKDELSEQEDSIKEAKNKNKILLDKYTKENDLKTKFDTIQEYYNNKRNEYIKKEKILRELKLETTTGARKIELRKEYARMTYDRMKQREPLLEIIKKKNNNEIKIKEEKIEIHSEYTETKEDKKDKVVSIQLIERIIQGFKENDGVITRKRFKDIQGDYKTKWDNQLFKHLRVQKLKKGEKSKPGNRYMKKEQEEHGPIIMTPGDNPSQIELTDVWKEILLNKEEEHENSEIFQKVIEFMKNNNGIISKSDFSKILPKEKWSKSLFDPLRYTFEENEDKEFYRKNEQSNYGPIIKELESQSTKIYLTEEWFSYLNENKKDLQEGNLYLGDKGYELCEELSKEKISQDEINKKRKKIYNKITKSVGKEINEDNYKSLLKDKEMKYMFELYDKYFFNNKLSILAKDNNCQWYICWNNRCTRSAGFQKCKIDGSCKTIEIQLASKVFETTIRKMKYGGLSFIKTDDANSCDSILSCLQFTFEHELVHALQNCFCQDWMYKDGPYNWSNQSSKKTGHSKTFMSILNNTFGHIDYRHQLFKNVDHVKDDEIKEKDEDGMGTGLGKLPDVKTKKKKEKKLTKEGKKLTKEGKKWLKEAQKDMKKRENK